MKPLIKSLQAEGGSSEAGCEGWQGQPWQLLCLSGGGLSSECSGSPTPCPHSWRRAVLAASSAPCEVFSVYRRQKTLMTVAKSDFACQASRIHTAQMQWEPTALMVLTAGPESQASHCPCLSLCPPGVWCFQAVVPAFARQLLRW